MTLRERFDAKWVEDPETGCWVWSAALRGKGRYGTIRVRGRHERAHRVSWLLHRGPIPDGLFVLHDCDNPPCVNPDHLFLGTQADNIADCVHKGRFKVPDFRGEQNGRSKLTEAEARELLALRSSGLTQRQVADRFGISDVQVGDIWNGESWRHLQEAI
jgi:hypothetical protein